MNFKMTRAPLDHLPLIAFAGRSVDAIEMQIKITTSDRIIFVSDDLCNATNDVVFFFFFSFIPFHGFQLHFMRAHNDHEPRATDKSWIQFFFILFDSNGMRHASEFN